MFKYTQSTLTPPIFFGGYFGFQNSFIFFLLRSSYQEKIVRCWKFSHTKLVQTGQTVEAKPQWPDTCLCPFISVSLCFCPFLFDSACFCPFLTVSVHFCLFLGFFSSSVSVHFCLIPSGSVCFSFFVSVSVCFFICLCQLLSVCIGFCPFLSFWKKIGKKFF